MDKHRRWTYSITRLNFWTTLFTGTILFVCCYYPLSSDSPSIHPKIKWGSPQWEKRVKSSARPRSGRHFSVLVTAAASFVGSHVSAALKHRGDGVVGLDNFNSYYDPSLKWARQKLLERNGIFVIEGDINDNHLLKKLFDIVEFSHVMHLAAQAGVRYAMKNPGSYIHSNIPGLVNILRPANQLIHSLLSCGHHPALFMDSILMYLFREKIERINQQVCMQPPRRLVKRLHIHITISMVFPLQG